MRFDDMSDEACKAYNDAIRIATHRAFVDCKPFAVYRVGDKFFVRDSKEALPPTPDILEGKIVNPVKLVCIAECWDAQTVQLRFDGAWSEWVRK